MTIYYLDPENGNDANDATTFAGRKKTLTAVTAAMLAPGDTIRIMASPDPASLGDATWTDGSGEVTFATQKNLVLDDGLTLWTAATNITAFVVINSNKRVAPAATWLNPVTAFTTGKMAHLPLTATLDLTNYQGISLWARRGTLYLAGKLELWLCTDTTGNTAAHVIPLEIASDVNLWSTSTWDNGAPLSSNINSIALYATADPGTTDIRLNNIVATKAGADKVTHNTIIGKNTAGEPEWYPVHGLSNTGALLGANFNADIHASSNMPPLYRGVSETVATYAQQGTPAWAAADRIVQGSGTEGSPITISGGWSRTDMETQTGKTYFQGRHYFGSNLAAANRSWLRFDAMGGINMVGAMIAVTGACADLDVDVDQAVGCYGGAFTADTSYRRTLKVKFDAIQGAWGGQQYFTLGTSVTRMTVKGRRIHGCIGAGTLANSAALTMTPLGAYHIERIDNNRNFAVANDNHQAGSVVTLNGTVMANNQNGDAYMGLFSPPGGDIQFNGCSYNPATVLFTNAVPRATFLASRENGVPTAHRILTRYYSAESQDAIKQDAAGAIAWKLTVLDTLQISAHAPATLPLARIACTAGALVTVTCWVRRSDTGLTAGLRLKASDMAGDPFTPVQTLGAAAVDAWEELTLTFTPTNQGVVEIHGVAWGALASAYFDTITVSQA